MRRLWQFLLLPAIGALLWSAATTPIQKEVPATYSLLWVAAELLALARIVAWVVDAQRIKLPYKRRAPNSNARGAIAVYMIVFGIVSCFLGTDAYHGPCPDVGDPAHHYVITIYALSVDKLPVPPEASGAMVSYTARGVTLASARLVGRYQR